MPTLQAIARPEAKRAETNRAPGPCGAARSGATLVAVDVEAPTLQSLPSKESLVEAPVLALVQDRNALLASASEYSESVDSVLAEAMCGSFGGCGVDANDPSPGEILAEKYRIEGFLGRGGMGTVFAARHVLTGRRVALKWMRGGAGADASGTARLIREASAVGRLDHPNVVAVYDAGQSDGHLYIAMELLHGESLERRLGRGAMPIHEALGVLLDVLRGVGAAHAAGIVHRDLKPGNIYLCQAKETVTAKVLDFGVSVLETDDADDFPEFEARGRVGTPQFMAPEQVRGEKVDARADLYSLCVTLYRMLAGRYPHEASTRNELFVAILTAHPKPIHCHNPAIPRRLSAVVARGMDRNREHRYQDANSLLKALSPWWKAPAVKGRADLLPWFVGVLGVTSVAAALALRTHGSVQRGPITHARDEGSVTASCDTESALSQPRESWSAPSPMEEIEQSATQNEDAPRAAEASRAKVSRGRKRAPRPPAKAQTPSYAAPPIQRDMFMRW